MGKDAEEHEEMGKGVRWACFHNLFNVITISVNGMMYSICLFSCPYSPGGCVYWGRQSPTRARRTVDT